MSKSMLANPKGALGFAGVVIAIAIVASFSVDAFLPTSQTEDEQEQAAEAEPEAPPIAQNEPSQPQGTAWGSGALSDSWSASASDTNTSDSRNEDGGINDEPTQSFDDYASSDEEEGPAPSERSSRPSSGPRITTRAAPSAPPLPSGSHPVPEITER